MVRDQFSSEVLQDLGERMQKEKEKYQKANGIRPAPQPKSAVTRLVETAGEFVLGILSPNGAETKTARSSRGGYLLNN